MSAYIIVRIEVKDWDRYREYTRLSPALVEKFGGKFVVRGGEVVSLEGPEEGRRIVILEFPSMEQALQFYRSPEYGAAKKVREGAAEAEFIAVDGV